MLTLSEWNFYGYYSSLKRLTDAGCLLDRKTDPDSSCSSSCLQTRDASPFRSPEYIGPSKSKLRSSLKNSRMGRRMLALAWFSSKMVNQPFHSWNRSVLWSFDSLLLVTERCYPFNALGWYFYARARLVEQDPTHACRCISFSCEERFFLSLLLLDFRDTTQ